MPRTDATAERHRPDPQTRRDADEQHGYGEVNQDELPLEDEPARAKRPLGPAGEPETEEHGFLRDDGQTRPSGSPDPHLDTGEHPVISPDDDRHPNQPDMVGDDVGPKDPDNTEEPPVDPEFLKDAYSANKPEDEKK